MSIYLWSRVQQWQLGSKRMVLRAGVGPVITLPIHLHADGRRRKCSRPPQVASLLPRSCSSGAHQVICGCATCQGKHWNCGMAPSQGNVYKIIDKTPPVRAEHVHIYSDFTKSQMVFIAAYELSSIRFEHALSQADRKVVRWGRHSHSSFNLQWTTRTFQNMLMVQSSAVLRECWVPRMTLITTKSALWRKDRIQVW